MQIYFLGAISAINKAGGDYLKIIDLLEEAKHHVWHEHITKRAPNKRELYPVQGDKEYYQVTINRIKYADAMFAEVSNSTANVGYEIAFALGISLPVYAFYKVDANVPTMFLGAQDDNFHLIPYTSGTLPKLIDKVLEGLIEDSKDQLMIPSSPLIKKYLNWIVEKNSVSKSTFVRSLIEAKMLKDSDYRAVSKSKVASRFTDNKNFL